MSTPADTAPSPAAPKAPARRAAKPAAAAAAASFRQAYDLLQAHAETLRRQTEPNIDDLLTIVNESMGAYKLCKERIDAVEQALEAALSGAGMDEAGAPAPRPAARAREDADRVPAPADDDDDDDAAPGKEPDAAMDGDSDGVADRAGRRPAGRAQAGGGARPELGMEDDDIPF